jgi:hypothetical protein
MTSNAYDRRGIKSKPSFYAASGATEEEISKAESDLTLTFSNEYKNYLSCFGFALFEGHEFTGICKAKRLNVVDVTKLEQEINQNVPNDWYVVEQLNIDGVTIWQSTTGEIYQSAPNTVPIKIFDSFMEYVGSL